MDEVDIVDINPNYAQVRMSNNHVKTVSLRDLAPLPKSKTQNNYISEPTVNDVYAVAAPPSPITPSSPGSVTPAAPQTHQSFSESSNIDQRRLSRCRTQVQPLNYSKLGGD